MPASGLETAWTQGERKGNQSGKTETAARPEAGGTRFFGVGEGFGRLQESRNGNTKHVLAPRRSNGNFGGGSLEAALNLPVRKAPEGPHEAAAMLGVAVDDVSEGGTDASLDDVSMGDVAGPSTATAKGVR